MRKLLPRESHVRNIPMSVQCNIISPIGRLQDIITFVIVRCRQMEVSKKYFFRYGIFDSQEIQNTETATQRYFKEMVV